MEKKTECEIVQDLLFSYTDGVLNKKSKELVDEHLAECEICQQKVKQIEEQTKQNQQEKSKKEIDYLKRIRRKAKIKNLLIVFIVLLIPFLVIYLYRFVVITFLIAKYDTFLKQDNFYIQKVSVEPVTNTIFTTKLWYKEGKYKKITYQREEGKQEEVYNAVEYGTIGERQILFMNEKEKIVKKQNFPFTLEKKNLIPSSNPINIGQEIWFARLGAPFYWKVSTDTYQIGRPYYVLSSNETEIWLDKKSGMLIQIKADSSSIQYYEGTNIIKNKLETIMQYEFKTNSVSEADVIIPNLEEYTIEEDNSIIELIQQVEDETN